MYLRDVFLHHIHAANVCEKFVNCERIFCMNPVILIVFIYNLQVRGVVWMFNKTAQSFFMWGRS